VNLNRVHVIAGVGNVGWAIPLWSMVTGGGYVSGLLLVQAVTSYQHYHFLLTDFTSYKFIAMFVSIKKNKRGLTNLKFEKPLYILNLNFASCVY